jgi:hypothetical protein
MIETQQRRQFAGSISPCTTGRAFSLSPRVEDAVDCVAYEFAGFAAVDSSHQ